MYFNQWDAKDVQDLMNNSMLNGIADDMFRFVDMNPDWNVPSEPRTGCLRCGKPLNDSEYAPYFLCGLECEYMAETEFENYRAES